MKNADRKEIENIVQSEIKKFIGDSFDKELKALLKKSNSQSRKELIQTIKDSLESAFKILWIKRDFWKSDIK